MGSFTTSRSNFLSAKESSPIRAVVCLLPVLLSLIPASDVVGAIITRVNRFRWAIWSGWALTTLGSGLTIIWDVDTSIAAWLLILIILGIGYGLLLNAQNFATQAIARPKDEASAAAMYAFISSFGIALGVGIGSSVFQNVMKQKLRHLGLPAAIADNSVAYVATLKTLSATSELKTQVLQAYLSGFCGVYGMFCGIAGLAGIASLFIAHFDMKKVLGSEHKLQEHKCSRKLGADVGTTDVSWNRTLGILQHVRQVLTD